MEKLREIFSSVKPEILTEENFSEISLLFESAVESRVSELKSELKEEALNETRAELEEFKNDIIDKLDMYMDQMAEDVDKEINPESSENFKTKFMEGILTKIVSVLAENDISIPNTGNTVRKLEKKVEKLKETVNSTMDTNIQLENSLLAKQAEVIFYEETVGLSLSETEKLKKILEDVEFDDEDSCRNKVRIMRDKFLNKSDVSTSINEEFETKESKYDDDIVTRFASYLKK